MKRNPAVSIVVTRILGKIFRACYETGAHTLVFDDAMFRAESAKAGLLQFGSPCEPADYICYDSCAVSSRRALLPLCIRMTEPNGWQWRLHRISNISHAFCLEPIDSIHPSNFSLTELRIPDATPEIIAMNSLSDEQALLAKVRYNRLIDIFLGVASYSLQNHLRTTVKGLGQIEIDEVYVGVDRYGCQYIIPVQAKGGNDQLSVVQARQDIACCSEKFPGLKCRAISAQFMDDSRIALFELCLDTDGLVRTVEERHYLLVPGDQIEPGDLQNYSQRSSQS